MDERRHERGSRHSSIPDPDMVNRAIFERAAARLRLATQGQGTIPPLRDCLAPDDVEGAYAVQDVNTRHGLASGRRIVGYKIGLTSIALQQRLGISEPDFGILFEDMRVADGGTLPAGAVLQPRVEGEIAVVLRCDVPSRTATAGDMREAVVAAFPAIEIVGSRIGDWAITAADTIADNGSAGAFVIGDTPLPLSHLSELHMSLRIDGAIVGEGLGSAALGDPLEALAWLARKVAGRGHPLCAGDIVLTGALAPMCPLPPDALVEVDMAGSGSVRFRSGAHPA